MKARICYELDLPINIELKDESDVDIKKRSYIHYLSEHKDILGAKCWGTKWLFENLTNEKVSVIEFFGGVGIMSVILQHCLNISEHVVGDIDGDCVEQTSGDERWESRIMDAKKEMLSDKGYDIYVMDHPSSSAINIHNNWLKQYDNIYKSNPKFVYWADTSTSYPLSINAMNYEKFFNKSIQTHTDYFKAYSGWLFERYGYSLIKVAHRYKSKNARAAAYCLAAKGKHELTEKDFKVEGNRDGFILF